MILLHNFGINVNSIGKACETVYCFPHVFHHPVLLSVFRFFCSFSFVAFSRFLSSRFWFSKSFHSSLVSGLLNTLAFAFLQCFLLKPLHSDAKHLQSGNHTHRWLFGWSTIISPASDTGILWNGAEVGGIFVVEVMLMRIEEVIVGGWQLPWLTANVLIYHPLLLCQVTILPLYLLGTSWCNRSASIVWMTPGSESEAWWRFCCHHILSKKLLQAFEICHSSSRVLQEIFILNLVLFLGLWIQWRTSYLHSSCQVFDVLPLKVRHGCTTIHISLRLC